MNEQNIKGTHNFVALILCYTEDQAGHTMPKVTVDKLAVSQFGVSSTDLTLYSMLVTVVRNSHLNYLTKLISIDYFNTSTNVS